MNIGIDIDDTINELSKQIKKYATKYNKEKNIEYKMNFTKWNWEDAFGWNKENEEEFIKKYVRHAYTDAGIKEKAAEVINKLKEEGNRIIIITSRSNNYCSDPYKISEKWLLEKGVKYDKLITNVCNKAEKCIENDIDIFIDDHTDFCEDVLNKTNTKILMFDSPYNQEEKRFKRVYIWAEVYSEIKKITKQKEL